LYVLRPLPVPADLLDCPGSPRRDDRDVERITPAGAPRPEEGSVVKVSIEFCRV
jgi:hypothetical protein